MLKRFALIMSALLLATTAFAAMADIDKQSDTAKSPFPRIEMVPVPGGCFRMGSNNDLTDESPAHDVCVSDFQIGKYEVTQKEWQMVMGDNPSRFNRCGDDCPVEQVSSNAALEFINRLNNISGKKYRLPTEAEWEYACTSGGKEETYCGGKDLDAIAWYDKNSGGKTHPVGQKHPNSLGIHDMSGNVWEWVQDWKGDYSEVKQRDPTGPSFGSTRVRRGGSWQYGNRQARSRWRSSGYPDDYALDLGFRLASPTDK